MAIKMIHQNVVRRFASIVLATFLALGGLVVSARAMNSSRGAYAQPAIQGGNTLYLPVIMGGQSPAGTYYCLEYEYGLIWTYEVITLHADGTSVYAYNPPYPGIVTGTWGYTASTQEITFTNFRWSTATYEAPDRIWASRYLPQAGFEIALSCNRQ